MRSSTMFINRVIHLNSYSFINGLNNISNDTIDNKWISLPLENLYNNNNNNNDTKAELETIFSEGILYGRGGPGTSTRKLSKCKTRKRMSRVGFLARIRTFNGRKIILRQRRKGRRYLGAKL